MDLPRLVLNTHAAKMVGDALAALNKPKKKGKKSDDKDKEGEGETETDKQKTVVLSLTRAPTADEITEKQEKDTARSAKKTEKQEKALLRHIMK